MVRAAVPSPTVQRLVLSLVGGAADHLLAPELERWLVSSPPFRTFVERHHDKIRKKVRTALSSDALRDVRAELLVARLLLADRRIGLEFEAYRPASAGPDFTLTVAGERPFNLEVTRLRGDPTKATADRPMLAKLRQLPPSTPNALLIAVEGDSAEALDVESAVRAIRALADARDEKFLARHRFDGPRAFYDRFLRLSAVLVWAERATGDARATAWVNGSARIAVPARALRACLACLRARA